MINFLGFRKCEESIIKAHSLNMVIDTTDGDNFDLLDHSDSDNPPNLIFRSESIDDILSFMYGYEESQKKVLNQNTMSINDHWSFLKSELNDIFPGLTISEYTASYCGCNKNPSRGPGVCIMIPCDMNNHAMYLTDKFLKILDLVDTHLCKVQWNGDSKHSYHHFIGSPEGYYYTLKFDKI